MTRPILQRPDRPAIGEIWCKGDWRLGTACGKCARCEKTRPQNSTPPDLVARQSTLRALDQIAGRIDAAADRLERDGDRPAMARMLRDDAVRLRGEITNSVRGMR